MRTPCQEHGRREIVAASQVRAADGRSGRSASARGRRLDVRSQVRRLSCAAPGRAARRCRFAPATTRTSPAHTRRSPRLAGASAPRRRPSTARSWRWTGTGAPPSRPCSIVPHTNVFYAFDLLHLAGESLTGQPLRARADARCADPVRRVDGGRSSAARRVSWTADRQESGRDQARNMMWDRARGRAAQSGPVGPFATHSSAAAYAPATSSRPVAVHRRSLRSPSRRS